MTYNKQQSLSQICDENLKLLERKEKIDKVNKSFEELMNFINKDMKNILFPK